MNDRSLLPMILSGGAGTRLWPLSREAAPKPFMPLPDGETLLAKTAARALSLPGVDTLITVTNRDYYFHTKDTYSTAGHAARCIYLLEPFGRNTAPAVALGALCATARGLGDHVLLVMPADHLIRDQRAFADAVEQARRLAATGMLVTFGITPTHPETGFGYIECGASIEPAETDLPSACRAHRFVEKPALAVAHEYLTAGRYVWNSGMFAFTANAILEAFARHAPGVLEAVRPVAQLLGDPDTSPMLEIDAALFAAVPDISIDYAIMEPAAAMGEVAVVRGTFDWSDVGSWQAVAALDGGRRGRQRRPGRARGDRDARHVRACGRSRRRHRRCRKPGHRRHGRCRARRAPRPPAAGEGRGRRAEGAGPRGVQAAPDGEPPMGHVHAAGGRHRASRSSASRSGPARHSRCSFIIGEASTGSSCAAWRASPTASASSTCSPTSPRSSRSRRSIVSKTGGPSRS